MSIVPEHPNWYQCNGICPGERGARYQTPLPEVPNAPVPSQADYSAGNVAWVMEMFAGALGVPVGRLIFRYENNTPNDPSDDIFVTHPGGNYLDSAHACNFQKSDALKRYEEAAKKSEILKLYQDNSPAGITYFNPICP